MEACRATRFLTMPRIKWAIERLSSNKAAGPDGIKSVVLKNLPDSYLQQLQVLYISSIYVGYVPQKWRHSKVVFIPKPGKEDYAKAKSFSPITLTSFIFKTLERVVLEHLEEEGIYEKLHINQHAFCKGSSCDSALLGMVDKIESSLLWNQYPLGIFLDIQGAFDNLSSKASIEGMRCKSLPPWIIEWYSHYLNHRSIETEIKGITATRKLTRGTPQGEFFPPWCGILHLTDYSINLIRVQSQSGSILDPKEIHEATVLQAMLAQRDDGLTDTSRELSELDPYYGPKGELRAQGRLKYLKKLGMDMV